MNPLELPLSWPASLEVAQATVRPSVVPSEDKVRYINAPVSGWARCFHNGKEKSLADGIRVDWLSKIKNSKGVFDVVVVREHCNDLFDKQVHVEWTQSNSNVVAKRPRLSGAKLRFDRKAKKIYLGEKFLAPAFTDKNSPYHNEIPLTKPGRPWKVLLPDSPHAKGRSYGSWGTVWFGIETDASDVYASDMPIDDDGKYLKAGSRVDDRYLHCGKVSLGCTTVGVSSSEVSPTEIGEIWKGVVEQIINCRLNNGNRYIGEIEVFESRVG